MVNILGCKHHIGSAATELHRCKVKADTHIMDGHSCAPIKIYLNTEQARSAPQAIICGFPSLDNNGATLNHPISFIWRLEAGSGLVWAQRTEGNSLIFAFCMYGF